MFDRNHNLNGNHGADLVSYLYGELDEHARNVFEAHLEQCDECAVELGAMSDARLGVLEWRRNDFDHLATPEITVSEMQPVVRLVPEREKAGIFTALLDWITSLSAFARIGAGLAAAALLVGVVYFVVSVRQPNIEVANKAPKAGTPAISEPPSNTSVLKEQHEQEARNVEKNKDFEQTAPLPAAERKPAVTRHPAASEQASVRRSIIKKDVQKLGPETAQVKAPRLNSFDDEEDTAPRLSDLFSQVGPDK